MQFSHIIENSIRIILYFPLLNAVYRRSLHGVSNVEDFSAPKVNEWLVRAADSWCCATSWCLCRAWRQIETRNSMINESDRTHWCEDYVIILFRTYHLIVSNNADKDLKWKLFILKLQSTHIIGIFCRSVFFIFKSIHYSINKNGNY